MFDIQVTLRLAVIALVTGIAILAWRMFKYFAARHALDSRKAQETDTDVSTGGPAFEIATHDRMAAAYPPPVAATMTRLDQL